MGKMIARFVSKTPKFWKSVQKTSLSIGGVLVVLWTTNSTMSLDLDDIILKVIKYGIIICITITGTAQFTIEDKK